MNSFEINTNGIFSIKEKTNEFYKMLVGGVFIYVSLFFITTYTIENMAPRIFLIIFLTLIYIFVFIVVPISLKYRLNKVIKKIIIEENQIIFITGKEFTFDRNSLKFAEVIKRFTGFSVTNKSGILVKTKSGKEYWIIEDFYNNYEELRQVLLG